MLIITRCVLKIQIFLLLHIYRQCLSLYYFIPTQNRAVHLSERAVVYKVVVVRKVSHSYTPEIEGKGLQWHVLFSNL